MENKKNSILGNIFLAILIGGFCIYLLYTGAKTTMATKLTSDVINTMNIEHIKSQKSYVLNSKDNLGYCIEVERKLNHFIPLGKYRLYLVPVKDGILCVKVDKKDYDDFERKKESYFKGVTYPLGESLKNKVFSSLDAFLSNGDVGLIDNLSLCFLDTTATKLAYTKLIMGILIIALVSGGIYLTKIKRDKTLLLILMLVMLIVFAILFFANIGEIFSHSIVYR